MKQRWLALGAKRGWALPVTLECWAVLEKNYDGEIRHYHDFSHIEDCLDELREDHSNRNMIELAIWFHDAIYEPRQSGNEEASARLATDWLRKLGESEAVTSQAERLIKITDHRRLPESEDEKVIVDIDLSILGRSPERYQEYTEQIRKEYSFLSEAEFREGRRKVMDHFLRQTRIFHTESFFQRFEHRARENIARELEQLKSG